MADRQITLQAARRSNREESPSAQRDELLEHRCGHGCPDAEIAEHRHLALGVRQRHQSAIRGHQSRLLRVLHGHDELEQLSLVTHDDRSWWFVAVQAPGLTQVRNEVIGVEEGVLAVFSFEVRVVGGHGPSLTDVVAPDPTEFRVRPRWAPERQSAVIAWCRRQSPGWGRSRECAPMPTRRSPLRSRATVRIQLQDLADERPGNPAQSRCGHRSCAGHRRRYPLLRRCAGPSSEVA